MPDPKIFLWTAAFVVAAAANTNGIKTLLADSLSKFLIKGYPVFTDGPKSLPYNSPDCTILCNWVYDNSILAEELFAKAWRSFETCALVNTNLWGKFFSS